MIKYSEQIILKFLGLIKLFFPFLKNNKNSYSGVSLAVCLGQRKQDNYGVHY